jgi:hypothetical protein
MALETAGQELKLALAACEVATPAERFSTSRHAFHALQNLARVADPAVCKPCSKESGEIAVSSVLEMLNGQYVDLTRSFVTAACECLCKVFAVCEAGEFPLNLATTLYEISGKLEDKRLRLTVGVRCALSRCIGRLCQWGQLRAVSALPSTVAALGRILKISTGDFAARRAAVEALTDVVNGAGRVGGSLHAEVCKIAVRSLMDKSATVRRQGARLASAVVRGSGSLHPSMLVDFIGTCARGLEDVDAGARLAMAGALGSILATAVRDKAAEAETAGFASARDQDKADDAEMEGGGTRMDKIGARLKEMGTEMKGGHGRLTERRISTLMDTGFTLESAMSLLSQILASRVTPLASREGLSGSAAAFVLFLRDDRLVQGLVTSSSAPWIVRSILGLLEIDRLPTTGNDACVVRTAIQWILRDGICSCASEAAQVLVAREIITILNEFVSSSDPGAGFSPLLNEHQLQVCLVELSQLCSALGQAAGALQDTLIPSVSPLLRHSGYGVRFEAAVTLAALGHALPHLAASLAEDCLAEIEVQHAATSPTAINSSDEPGSPGGGSRRHRMFSLHGQAAAVSMLMQVIEQLPLGVPAKVSERALAVAEVLIMTQFPPSCEDSGSVYSMGVVCTCVRTGWSLLSALLSSQGPRWGEMHCMNLLPYWKKSVHAALDGVHGGLEGAEVTHELIFLDASTRALLCFVRHCVGALYAVPNALAEVVGFMEGAMSAVEGRLKSPTKTQGIICRTLLKAMLMECFSWLPPGAFPSTCRRLFSWGLEHAKMYTANDVGCSLLPVLVNPQDGILDMPSGADGKNADGNDCEFPAAALAMHALAVGIPIGHQEREAMASSGSIWASRMMHRPELSEPPTPLHGSSWRMPAPSCASINVRLLDAAITVFAATFGHQGEDSQLEAIEGIVSMLPEEYRPAVRKNELFSLQMQLPALTTEDERKQKHEKTELAILNVATMILSLLQNLPPYTDSHHNVELPWVGRARSVLMSLLSASSPLVRRAVGEAIALMGVKIGNGYVIYLVQALLETLRSKTGSSPRGSQHGSSHAIGGGSAAAAAPVRDPSSPQEHAQLRAGALFALAAIKRSMGSHVMLEWLWADVRKALAVGGDVPFPTRLWGLHSLTLLVRSSDTSSSATVYSQVQESLAWCEGIVDLIEAHLLGSWPAGDESLLTAALASLMGTVLPMLQSLRPDSGPGSQSRRLLFMWQALCSSEYLARLDPRAAQACLAFAEILAVFAPTEMTPCLDDVLNVLLHALTSPNSVSSGSICAAARSIKYLCCRWPSSGLGGKVDVPLLKAAQETLSAAVWDGAPAWRGLVLSRDLEAQCFGLPDAASALTDALEAIAACDEENGRPLQWLLLGRALVMGSAQSGDSDKAVVDWSSYCQARRRSVADHVAGLGSVRWQVKVAAVNCCQLALRLISRLVGSSSEQVLDIKRARVVLEESLRGARGRLSGCEILPELDCLLFLEDLISTAVTAATASAEDSELQALQEGGVILLASILTVFGDVLDPDADASARRARFLEQSVSQITSAARPALSSAVSPSLVRRGCILVNKLASLGLVSDALVLKRLIRQVLPTDLSAVATENTPQLRGPPSACFSAAVAFEERCCRIGAAAVMTLTTFAKIGDSPEPINTKGLEQALLPHLPQLRPCWIAMCTDAARVRQGWGRWPHLAQNRRGAGLTYPPTDEVAGIVASLRERWPAMAAAYAVTSSLGVATATQNAEEVDALCFLLSACMAELITIRDSLLRHGAQTHSLSKLVDDEVRTNRPPLVSLHGSANDSNCYPCLAGFRGWSFAGSDSSATPHCLQRFTGSERCSSHHPKRIFDATYIPSRDQSVSASICTGPHGRLTQRFAFGILFHAPSLEFFRKVRGR